MSKSVGKHIIVPLLFVVLGAGAVFGLSGSLFETNMAGYLQVKQAAVAGTLTCRLEPGMYGQWFGDIHTYPEAETFFFTAERTKDGTRDNSLPTRFNDGAKADVTGSVRVIFPVDCQQLVKLHRKFHSEDGVMNKLVLPAVRKALFSTGPHMSAGESYAERRGEFAALAEDQLVNGIIMVDKHLEERPDPISGDLKHVWVLEKRSCAEEALTCVGGYVRDPSAFKEFGMKITNFVIDGIAYPETVLKQIERQRQARMDIITQQAEAKQAEARAAKAKAEKEAAIAETRAKEEVEKTQRIVKAEADKAEAVLEAQKNKEVAELDLEASKLEKQASINRGEGEARRRQLIMSADGALSQKLNSWLEAQKAYAQALAAAQPGALVPTLVMGSGNSGSASNWIDMLMAKTARDLALEIQVKRK